MNWTVKKKVNFVNSSQNEGLSPSGIALSFDGFGSISWHSGFHPTALSVFTFFPRISYFFDLSITEKTWVIEMRIWCIKFVNILVLYDADFMRRIRLLLWPSIQHLDNYINDVFLLALKTGNPVYVISNTGARRMWPVSRGCLLLPGTWSYLCIFQKSVLPCTQFCICFLDFDYVLHIVTCNFAILYLSTTSSSIYISILYTPVNLKLKTPQNQPLLHNTWMFC
jgi:hypothetical protein